MVKRLTISVPDELAADLNNFKSGINVSAVCAAALFRRIREMAFLAQQDSLLHQTAARLRAERQKIGDADRVDGFQAGAQWASESADYATIKWFVEEANRQKHDRAAGSLALAVNQELGDFADNFNERVQEGGFSPEPWWAGFLVGVLDVWARLRPLVEG